MKQDRVAQHAHTKFYKNDIACKRIDALCSHQQRRYTESQRHRIVCYNFVCMLHAAAAALYGKIPRF